MSLEVQEEARYMITAKSADCLKLDLNTRLEKKNEIKLLNAKLRNLKNKCRALREESKTDREMLSNLINVTNHLEHKTNEGIQACRQVENELINKQSEMKETDNNNNRTLLGVMEQKNNNLEIDSHCREENVEETFHDDEREDGEFLESSLDFIVQKDKNIICSALTDRSVTASQKTEGDEQRFLYENNAISIRTGSDSDESTFKRANTISFSPSKQTKIYRKHSLTSYSPSKKSKSKSKIRHSNENLFLNYIYAIILTIVLTIILFKLL